jgi:hypothetical protein
MRQYWELQPWLGKSLVSLENQLKFQPNSFLSLKNKTKSMRTILLSIALFTAVLSSCGSAETKTTAAKYQCPMKWEGEKTYDSTGTCPLCKMEMKEVK